MNILAIECSRPQASLCLHNGREYISDSAWQAERNHDQYLFPALSQALRALGDAPLDLILIGAGPGSYGGVRVALAAAVGIATVRKSQMVAICSWDSLAEDGQAIISDAKRGGWTIRRSNGTIEVLTREALLREIETGLKVCSIEDAQFLQKHNIPAEKCGLVPTARGLVASWLTCTPEQQKELAARAPEPIYVRPPHITEAKRKPWEVKH